MQASRYFFALWPSPVVCRQLQQLQALLPKGRFTHPSDFHLTLAFLGQPVPDQLPVLHQLVQTLPRPAFELQLDTLGAFNNIRLAWVGPSCVPPALLQLHSVLVQRLADCGIKWHDQHGFRPHVTLARNVVVPAQSLGAPVYWWADRLVLAHSHPSAVGAKYRVIASSR